MNPKILSPTAFNYRSLLITGSVPLLLFLWFLSSSCPFLTFERENVLVKINISLHIHPHISFFFFYAIPQIIFVFNILKYFHFLASKSCLSSSPPLLACCCLWQQNSGFLHTKAMSSFSALFGMAAIFLGPHYGCKWDQYSLSHTHTTEIPLKAAWWLSMFLVIESLEM